MNTNVNWGLGAYLLAAEVHHLLGSQGQGFVMTSPSPSHCLHSDHNKDDNNVNWSKTSLICGWLPVSNM